MNRATRVEVENGKWGLRRAAAAMFPFPAVRVPKLRFARVSGVLVVAVALLLIIDAGDALGQCGPWGCKLPGSAPVAEPPMAGPVAPLVPVPPRGDPPAAVKQCYYSLVRIKCGAWGGSGTYLGNRLVLTCEHVVRNAQQSVYVTFPGDQMVEAAVLATDYASDVALLELKGGSPPQARGVPIEEGEPSLGQAVYSAGYGKSGTLAISAGRVSKLDQYTISYDPTNGVRRQRRTTEASGLSEPGDSGGAWLTDDGKLLGVVWGGRQQDLSVSATTGLGAFLRDACDRWRRPFPRPDNPPPPAVTPPVPPANPPKVDLSPIENRLADIDRRLATLENPPKEKGSPLLGWLAALVGVVAGGFLFFKTNDA